MSSAQSTVLRPKAQREPSNPKKRRAFSMELPERFRVDDEEEDAAKPDESHPETFVQQSMYGIIAAAHSKGVMRTSFHQDSGSDTDTEAEGSRRNSRDMSHAGRPSSKVGSSLEGKRERLQHSDPSRRLKGKTTSSAESQPTARPSSSDSTTQSQLLPSRTAVTGHFASLAAQREGPMLDRKIQARAKADMEPSPSSSMIKGKDTTTPSRTKALVALPEALAEIFHFDEPEEVISEYKCWYLQTALLQGYMYITQRHVCFYAYLQKKGNIIKSGYLGKQGKHNPRFRRYWFTLKGDVLSYFSNANDPYFPSGSIDLRYGIAADMAPLESGQDRDTATAFNITTDKRVYHLRAESTSSAKEWVRQLQKVIFRSHNEGDSVKISLPLENIVDVEPTSVIDFADTIKLRVMDDDETYAVDEYFFTFSNLGKDALNVLSIMTQGNQDRKMEKDLTQVEASLLAGRALPSGREILIDAPSKPRSEVSRTSFDRERGSFSGRKRTGSLASGKSGRSRSPMSPSGKESSESLASEDAVGSPDGGFGGAMDMSASQVLTTPTLRVAQSKRPISGSTIERLRLEAQSTTPSTSSVGRPLETKDDITQLSKPASSKPDAISQPTQADSTKSRPQLVPTSADSALRAMSTPLQHAYTLADAVRSRGKQVSSYLSSSPKTYYDKFSGAIAGGKRHYSDTPGLDSDERTGDPEEGLDRAEHERRFQEHFALPSTERLRAVFYCWLHRVLPLYGKIYISDRRFCFRSLLYGTRTKLVVPFRDVDNVTKETAFRWGYPGMVLVIKGHEELFFDFGSGGVRDDCVVTVLRGLDVTKASLESVILTEEERLEAEEAAAENELLQDARQEKAKEAGHAFPSNDDDPLEEEDSSILFDDPNASLLDFKPKKPLRITCLTIGSRGDVQPYIALGKGLLAHGHQVKIATHIHFKDWIEGHGITFAPVEGDPAELMRLCVELGMFTPSFIYETGSFAREWLDKLMATAWRACQDSDLLIESPSAMCGIHIAEALGIPYFRAFTMPWTRTRAYPHAFATPNSKMGGRYNYMTYVIFEKIFWQMTAGQINKWRRKTLQLGPTDLGKMQLNKVPFLYNFSPSVVVPPLDFSDWIRITGYWFLDEGGEEWTPPEDLVAFIRKCREDKMKLVYIGFGSIPIADSMSMTRLIIEAVVKADVRCIFSKGWSDHFDKTDSAAPELPSSMFPIRSAPHDWLFKQIDCAVHHGGAGTTGASLRAGVPTVIKPFFGDQFFFAGRVEDLGVGIYVKRITGNNLGKAIWLASHDERMRQKAHKLAEQIRQEDGVGTAINAIYRDLEYAKSLIKKSGAQVDAAEGEEEEESWTFVENKDDVDYGVARRMSDVTTGAWISGPTGLGYRLWTGRR